jgi:hypothetical protein
MEQKSNLSSTKEEPIHDPQQYQRLVGRLIYLTITQPDIPFVVNVLRCFMQTLRQPHMAAALKVLRYLKRNPGHRLLMSSSSNRILTAYYDSDWAACQETRKSIIGYYIFLETSMISWKTKC